MFAKLQDTLAYATALLNEKEQSGSSNGSDGSPANENADRSLRQVAFSNNPASCLDQWGSEMTHGVTAAHTASGTKMDHLAGSVKSCKGSL